MNLAKSRKKGKQGEGSRRREETSGRDYRKTAINEI